MFATPRRKTAFFKYSLLGLCLESVWSSANSRPLKLSILCFKWTQFHPSRRSQFREAVVCSDLPFFAVKWNHTWKRWFLFPATSAQACLWESNYWFKVGKMTQSQNPGWMLLFCPVILNESSYKSSPLESGGAALKLCLLDCREQFLSQHPTQMLSLH